jgi:hypothetical protein
LTTNWFIETGSSVVAVVTEVVVVVVSDACGVAGAVWARARTVRPRAAIEHATNFVNADRKPGRRDAGEGSRGTVMIMVMMVLRLWIQ